MTQMRKILYSLAIFATLSLTGCTLGKMIKLAKNQQMTVTPNPLELHGDSVRFEMSALLPVKMLKKNTTYTLLTSYKYGEKSASLGEVKFNGNDLPNAASEQPRVSNKFAFAYAEDMKRGNVEIEGVAAISNGKSKKTPTMQVATGVITTSRLVRDVYYVSYAPTGYDGREELVPTNVEFFFEQGKANLRASESKSARGKFLDAFIAKKNVTRSITILGTHSPEGSELINTNLSGDRAKVIQDYYKARMKKFDYKKQADSFNFIIKPVVQDWTLFLALLEANTSIDQSQKDKIKNIVNGSGASFVEKEKQLKALPSYNAIFKSIYPVLRTARTEILTPKVKKTEAEISTIAKNVGSGSVSADSLNNEELLHAATLTPDLSEREGIYKAAVKKADSYQAHNNLGAVYLEQAMKSTDNTAKMRLVDLAITHLETSAKKQSNAEATNNLGVAYLMKGENQKGIDRITEGLTLTSAGENQKGVNGVKGALEIKRGSYDAAIATLSAARQSADNSFNKGLAYLLKKDFQNAETSLNEAIEQNSSDAKAYYVKAVNGARMNNKSTVITNLAKAVSLDSNLKAWFTEDLEFANFKDDAEVRDALK